MWELYSHKGSVPEQHPLPVAVVLTLPAAGSENSPNTVLSDEASGRKLGFKHMGLRPVLSIVVFPHLYLTFPAHIPSFHATPGIISLKCQYEGNI